MFTYITGWYHYSSGGGQPARKYVAVSTKDHFSYALQPTSF